MPEFGAVGDVAFSVLCEKDDDTAPPTLVLVRHDAPCGLRGFRGLRQDLGPDLAHSGL
jgi:hypothetical protein